MSDVTMPRDAEVWKLLNSLGVFERNMILKIFRPVCIGDDFNIKTNKEQYYLLNDIERLYGFSHIVWIKEEFLMQKFAGIDDEADNFSVVRCFQLDKAFE